jgi:hypothetical protein
MRLVSTAWIPATLEEFELETCLGLHVEHARAAAAHPLTVLVMEGFGKITPRYAEYLAAGHVMLVDASAATEALAARLPGLAAIASRYDVLCFLRWPLIREMLAGEPFLHLDLDLFFQRPFAEVAALFAGRTCHFGSPCLVAVADLAWLDAYCEAIEAVARDRDALEAAIGYQGHRRRARIASDQDLLRGLEQAGRLGAPGAALLRRDHAVFVNPLTPPRPPGASPIVAARRDGMDLFDGKPVLFWHLQNSFADYLGRFLCFDLWRRRRRGPPYPPVRFGNPVAALRPSAENIAFTLLDQQARQQRRQAIAQGALTLDRILGMTAREPTDFLARAIAARHFVLRGEGRALFSAEHWWQPGVFAPLPEGAAAPEPHTP